MVVQWEPERGGKNSVMVDVPIQIARPTRQHALHVARSIFVNGRRLDMESVCAAADIGRTTLYRWVGDRERLIGAVLAELTDETWRLAEDEAEADGLDRALDTIRRFMDMTATFPPLRRFAERESQLALRIMLSPHGPVNERLCAGVQRAFVRSNAGSLSPETTDILVQLGTALEWTPIAIGEPPEIERAIKLMRSLLMSSRPE
jgi:AcrR family transcriptional regulator